MLHRPTIHHALRWAPLLLASAPVFAQSVPAPPSAPPARAAAAPRPISAPVIELRGGRWFDGTRFVAGSRWMQGGHFVPRPTIATDSIIRLDGQWLVPPYGDAHTHSPDGARDFDTIRGVYLGSGVFYVQTLANHRSARQELRAQLGRARNMDVSFADAAVTSTGGHPQILYELLAMKQRPFWQSQEERWAAARSVTQDGAVYFRLDSLPQLDSIVGRLARDPAPILKIMLVDSEDHARHFGDSTHAGAYGMPPALVAPLVQAAHALGRKVWAHVESAYDFSVALAAGVDGFAHVPGYGAADAPDSTLSRYILPDSLVRLAGARRVMMTATAALGVGSAGLDADRRRRYDAVVRRNLRALHRAGARILVGSDTYADARIIRAESNALADLLGLTPVQQLRLWAVETPQAIFPGRRIGVLQPGYEASVLSLSCDPTIRRDCLTQITGRLKQGEWITP